MSKALAEIRALESKLRRMKRDYLSESASITDTGANAVDPIFLTLKSGGIRVALPVAQVEEVVQMVALSRLAEQRHGLAGLLDYHGKMLEVVDLGRLLGAEPTPLTPNDALVICITELKALALRVEETDDVVTVDPGGIHVATETLSGLLQATGVLALPGEATETATIIDATSIALALDLAGEGAAEEASR